MSTESKASPTILVLEDDPNLREMLVLVLREAGFYVIGAESVSAALDVARTNCRRAERQVAGLIAANPEILRYLNRLADLCWILARFAEKKSAAG